jgi:gas vesicle protein
MNNGKIIVAALTSLAVGGILGVLLAPDKGSRTRRKVMDKTEDWMEDVKDKVSNYLHEMKAKMEQDAHFKNQSSNNEVSNHDEIKKVLS